MIIDNIKYISQYKGLSPNFRTAVEFLQRTCLDELKTGRFEIDGSNVYAIVSDKDLDVVPTDWEMHNKYADIQFVISGCESIGYYPRMKLETEPVFPEGKDGVTMKGVDGVFHELNDGDFMILLPQDVHLPNCPGTKGNHSKKILLKVIVDD